MLADSLGFSQKFFLEESAAQKLVQQDAGNRCLVVIYERSKGHCFNRERDGDHDQDKKSIAILTQSSHRSCARGELIDFHSVVLQH